MDIPVAQHSTPGNVESQYAIVHGQSLDLSEQQLVDCVRNTDCERGLLISSGVMYLMNGVEPEGDYPYTASKASCKFDPGKANVRVTSCIELKGIDENTLASYLQQKGPISVAVDATDFQTYTAGVLQSCRTYSSPKLHAVLLVGYGNENGEPIWIIKNSWGSTWGNGGYIKIKRGLNSCGLLNYQLIISHVA
ncbi:pro-cathepsin H-like [Galleria mellonella]|uniref:Pro-cathepsin H-like n=1 Tax=Galleria mellonella TaxID=7137 RepID=A0ABM3N4K0_GALME|nr:pro-cathepsin H-like [Galleria mellonella]